MSPNALLQIGVYMIVLLLLVKPLGGYMARIYEGEPTFLTPVIQPLERVVYRLGASVRDGRSWRQ